MKLQQLELHLPTVRHSIECSEDEHRQYFYSTQDTFARYGFENATLGSEKIGRCLFDETVGNYSKVRCFTTEEGDMYAIVQSNTYAKRYCAVWLGSMWNYDYDRQALLAVVGVFESKPIEDLPWVSKHKVASHTGKGVVYEVTQHEDDNWSCTCPAFKYRKTDCCKHIKETW